ncbi:MAG: hypothetical protein HYV18_07715 [Gammaproteobacteria bacterium]|nr:hypothetical protein [Gammaproteobacteria bacterium]
MPGRSGPARAAPATLVQEFAQALPTLKLDDSRLNANAAEDWLAAALVRHGFALNPGAPTVVLMHLGQFGISGHGWKFSGPTGWLEPVRIFGERHPLVVADVSAVSDPYAGTSQTYSSPIPEQADAPMATLIRDLTEYRVLQGSIYPISTAPCHAVAGILGIGTYDDNPGKRMSMSWVHDAFHFLLDPESPGCAVGSVAFSDNYCKRKEYMNWWDYLLSHETGHILGQRHTHDVNSNTASAASNDSFSAVWSSMSYQQDGRMIDFGAVDHNNWLRNRAGFALQLAAQNGREGSPAWNAAMDAARALDWQGVWEALR